MIQNPTFKGLDQKSNIILLFFCSCPFCIMQVCPVRAVFVSDWQIISSRWSHPILGFSQPYKFKMDQDFDLTCSKQWQNQSKKEHILLFLWKLYWCRNIGATEHDAAFIFTQVNLLDVLWKEEKLIGNSQFVSPIYKHIYIFLYIYMNISLERL